MKRPKNSAGTVISVRVVPRSSLEEIARDAEGVWKVKLTAPALEGRANEALICMLSKRLGIRKSEVQIISGEKARLKRVKIEGLDGGRIEDILGSDRQVRKKGIKAG